MALFLDPHTDARMWKSRDSLVDVDVEAVIRSSIVVYFYRGVPELIHGEAERGDVEWVARSGIIPMKCAVRDQGEVVARIVLGRPHFEIGRNVKGAETTNSCTAICTQVLRDVLKAVNVEVGRLNIEGSVSAFRNSRHGSAKSRGVDR